MTTSDSHANGKGEVDRAKSGQVSRAMPATAVPYGITDPVEAARVELKAALAAIEVRGNLPKRLARASDQAILKTRTFAHRNPAGAMAAIAGVSAAVGGLVWAIARAIAR